MIQHLLDNRLLKEAGEVYLKLDKAIDPQKVLEKLSTSQLS